MLCSSKGGAMNFSTNLLIGRKIDGVKDAINFLMAKAIKKLTKKNTLVS